MAIRLLVADLDGTIVTKNGISERSIAAIAAARRAGVKVTFATGRMHASAVQFAEMMNIDLPIITCNGAMLKTVGGEIVSQSCMDPDLARAVIDECLRNGWHIQWYIDDRLYVYERQPEMWVGYDEKEGIVIHEAKSDLDRFTQKVIQMVVLRRGGNIKEIAAYLQNKFKGKLFAPQTAEFCIDIVATGMHKAVGVEILAKQYGFDRSEIMAIGDSDNDIDMVRYAGLGVAMGNAYDSLKAVADVVTLPCDEDGFAAAVETYILKQDER